MTASLHRSLIALIMRLISSAAMAQEFSPRGPAMLFALPRPSWPVWNPGTDRLGLEVEGKENG